MNKYIDVEKIIIPKEFFEGSNVPMLLDWINHQPVADVRENVKGEWIAVENACFDTSYKCSICGEEFFLEVGTPKENEYNFCPNCGADMRGEK